MPLRNGATLDRSHRLARLLALLIDTFARRFPHVADGILSWLYLFYVFHLNDMMRSNPRIVPIATIVSG